MLHRTLPPNPKLRNPSHGRARILVVTIIALIVLLAGVQIVLSSQIAVSGEKIKNLENRRQELSLGINRLQVEVNKISSLSYIEKEARRMGMVDGVGRMEYISIEEYLASLR